MNANRSHRRPPSPARHAFTLVELLVVIGIVALLISILLPSLSRARRAASTIACAANLRSILQGMQMYVAENNGYFPGGGNSSGAFLMTAGAGYGDANCPSVVQISDWQSPIATQMGVKFETGGALAERQARFLQLNEFQGFRCPDNEILASAFGGGGGWPTVTLNSYVTALVFHLKRNEGSSSSGDGPRTIARLDWNPPPGYIPKITKVGDTARKIYIADGARYSNASTVPDYSPTWNGSLGGVYSDQGAFAKFSNSWYRGLATGNTGTGRFDARLYGYRHGKRTPGGPGDAFRMNVGFFDGHVENLGDLESANPAMWVPKGTLVKHNTGQMFDDVLNTYGGAGDRVITE